MPTTRVGTVNQTGGSGRDLVYLVKTHLAANGWTVIGSGDGLAAFSNTGDIITSAGTGAGGMGNPLAWFLIKDPGNNRAFQFQRTSAAAGTANDYLWRIVTAETVTWTGGSATVSKTSATGDGLIIGGGTAAAPTFASLMPTAVISIRMHVVSDTVPIPGSNVYMFWFGTNQAGSNIIRSTFMVDGLRTGTYEAGDTAPWIVVNSANLIAASSFGAAESGIFKGWQAGVFSSFAASAMGVSNVGTPSVLTNRFGVDPITGLDWLLDTVVYRSATNTPSGIKGTLYLFKLPSELRDFGNTINLATDPYIYWQGSSAQCAFALPWIDGVVPSL